MPNPFNIEDMNGVTFDPTSFLPVTQFQLDGEGSANGSKVYPQAMFGLYPPRDPSFSLGSTIIVSADYRAGYAVPGTTDYILPTFGAIQFENVTWTSGPLTGQPKTFYIHGFSEHGILLSPTEAIGENGYIQDGIYSTRPLTAQGQTYILSPNGFEYYGAVDGFPMYPQASGEYFDKDPGVLAVPVCFVAGTRIQTDNGPLAVELLAVGDHVITASGKPRSIKWIGDMVSRPRRHARPEQYHPVRVEPHAFAPNMPSAPVRLSPGHAVFVDGVLVPISGLVNGASIVQEDVAEVRYFHIELESHDVLLAEGLPCESYMDDGNRQSFRNNGAYSALYGRLDPQCWDGACAPVVADGPQLTAIRERLLRRAETLGWVRVEESDLHLIADGTAVSPHRVSGDRYTFQLPEVSTVSLRSNAGVLSHLMPSLTDGRRLGVAIAELRIDNVAVDLGSDLFGDGFYPVEQQHGHAWRWTNGEALLHLEGRPARSIEVRIAMVAPSWIMPAERLRISA